MAPELAAESVVVHGTAERVSDPAVLDGLAVVYEAKYGSGFPDPGVDPVFAVRPDRVIAVVEADFTGRATRWTFDR